MNAVLEAATREVDGVKACTLFATIECALSNVRASTEVITVISVQDRIREMMRTEFGDLKVVRKFEVLDGQEFREWHVRVRYPVGREVGISHES